MGAAGYASNLVSNGSFELGAFVNNNGYGDTGVQTFGDGNGLSDWTLAGGKNVARLENGNNYTLTASDGTMFLDLTGYSNTMPTETLSQQLATVSGQTYDVSFDVGVDNAIGVFERPVTMLMSLGTFSGNYTNNLGGPGNQWQHFDVQVTASQANAVLAFQGTVGVDYIGLDNISVTPSSTPEPITLSLMAVGLGFAARRRLQERAK